MKKEPLNYHAIVYAKNWAKTKFDFHAESPTLAHDHIMHIIKFSDVSQFDDWENGEPDTIKYIQYKFKGNVKWIEILKP